MRSGSIITSELHDAFAAMLDASAPADMKPGVSNVITLLKEAQPGISSDKPGIDAGVIANYAESIAVFEKGLTALDGPGAEDAAADLRSLAKQALDHIPVS